VRREYQKTRLLPHLSFPLNTQIIRLPWLADLPSSFPTHRKENIPYVQNRITADLSTSKGLRRSLRETGVVIGDSDDESKFQRWGEGTEREKC